MKVNRRVLLLAMLALLLVSLPAIALASSHAGLPNPGERLAEWLRANILPFFPLGLALASLWFLFRREFTGFIGFAVFAAVVAIFVYFPQSVVDFARAVWVAVTG